MLFLSLFGVFFDNRVLILSVTFNSVESNKPEFPKIPMLFCFILWNEKFVFRFQSRWRNFPIIDYDPRIMPFVYKTWVYRYLSECYLLFETNNRVFINNRPYRRQGQFPHRICLHVIICIINPRLFMSLQTQRQIDIWNMISYARYTGWCLRPIIWWRNHKHGYHLQNRVYRWHWSQVIECLAAYFTCLENLE